MKITELMAELQAWHGLHGDLDITYSAAFFDDEERPVRGLGMAEDENTGAMRIVLFTNVEAQPLDVSHELN